MKYIDLNYFEGITDICLEYIQNNYDLCYLSAMHKKNKEQGADTIIVGSSHAMNGVIEKEIPAAGDVIQFSISSQDLYYDLKHIKMAIEEGKRPLKRCLINLGYYMLYQDLSKSELVKGIIPSTYMNLFGDDCVHNYLDAKRIDPISRVSLDADKYPKRTLVELCEYWTEKAMMEQSSYYGPLCTREQCNMLGVKKVIWSGLSSDEKRAYAVKRVIEGHNKHLKHTETRCENSTILADMVRVLVENDIKVYFFITPYTKYYMELIDPRYKSDILEALENLPYPVEFLDMNDYSNEFDDSDFLDTDHLNLHGAQKATALLNSFIEIAEEKE